MQYVTVAQFSHSYTLFFFFHRVTCSLKVITMNKQNSGSKENIYSPEYWKSLWELSLSGDTNIVRNGYSTSGFWDTMSRDYDSNHDSDHRKELEKTIDSLIQKGFLAHGMRVLDIGCGTGSFAFSLARHGAEVTALDFSPGMLEQLRGNCPADLSDRINTVQADWNTINLDSYGWRQGFDLVIANMTPAVYSPATFRKLMDASRGGCSIKAWARRKQSILLASLWKTFMGEEMKDRASYMTFMFNLVYAMGYYPDIAFSKISWLRSESVDHITEYYASYFSGILKQEKDSLTEKIRAHIEEITENGMVQETIIGYTGTMMWSLL